MSYAQLRELIEETYGAAPSPRELEWWFEENPVGPRILSLEEHGADGMSLFRVSARESELLAGFIVHAVTAPSARGRGVFTRLQRANQALAEEAGAELALGFTTAAATRVLVGKLGWEELARPRVWARFRIRRGAGLRGAEIAGFGKRHEQVDLSGPAHLLKDAAWLDWRYRDSPRPYRLVEEGDDYAVLGIGRHRGLVAGAVCELVGGLGMLRRAVAAVDARLVLALPNRGERALYAAAGFVPTPWRLRFVGRPLNANAPLPRDWRLSLGDTDFF